MDGGEVRRSEVYGRNNRGTTMIDYSETHVSIEKGREVMRENFGIRYLRRCNS